MSRSQSENWVKKIQAAAYNGARKVVVSDQNSAPSVAWGL